MGINKQACIGGHQLTDGLCMKQDRCTKWQKTGECNTNAGWMNTNCRKSCGSCTNVQSFTQVLITLSSFTAVPPLSLGLECGKK